MKSPTLDTLLTDIANEVTEEEVSMAQTNLAEAQSDETVRMVWRMYAVDPFEEKSEPPFVDNK
jgi:predicted O-methyltransferase YrrM